jgi:transcriptional regulator with XRE-family HTH domain
MTAGRTPVAVTRALRELGQQLTSWRKLRQLTAAELADRAGIGVATVHRLERGDGATGRRGENLLRVARALGVLDTLVASLDPYSTDVGRLRADEVLPARVRSRRRS